MNTPKISALIMIYTFFVILFSLTGCEGKQICSYCGEEKYCKEYTIIDKTRYICKDCLDSELDPTSANVIFDYTSELLDPSVYGIISEDSISEEVENSSVEELAEASINAPSLEEIMNTPHLPASEVSQDTIDISNNKSIIENITAKLNASGYNLVSIEDKENSYDLYKEETNMDIVFDFSNLSTAKPGLTITLNNSQNENAFVNASINSSLGFLDSNDFEGLGYSIYNNASQYGNYSCEGHGFYYMPGTTNDNSANHAVLTFQITTK